MEKQLLKDILREAKIKAEEFQRYHNHLEIICARNRELFDNAPAKNIQIPKEWSVDKKNNPFYVIKHSKQIARAISRKILNGTYSPSSPIQKEIPKKGGGTRTVSIYQIPDSAVSSRFFHDLLSKNKHRFSSFAYAYRNDRNIHFAIQDIAQELNNSPSIFVAEFDFSDFFGSIRKEHILAQLTENAFSVNSTEMKIIEAFLEPFEQGIPLGTSISLFLANVACWKLDRRLENEGIRFARYADDTIILAKEYSKINKAVEIINAFSKESSININHTKSDGISLLQRNNMPSEFHRTKEYVEFAEYKISTESVGIRDSSIRQIKKQISYLLYRNLIQPLKTNPVNQNNIPRRGEDKHFLAAITQVREYIYGDLSELCLTKYLNGTYKRVTFKGIVSFYPLVTDEEQMKELDRWLVSAIINILRLRKKILLDNRYVAELNWFPYNVDSENFVSTCKSTKVAQIPSFLRILKAIQKGVKEDGIEKTMNPLLY